MGLWRKNIIYVLLLTLAVSLPLLATTAMYLTLSARLTADAYTIAEKRVRRVAGDMNQWVGAEAHAVNVLVRQIEGLDSSVSRDQLLAILRGTMSASDSLSSVYYGTTAGEMFNATNWVGPPGWDLRTRPWYIKATSETGLVFTEPFLNASRDAMIITAAQAVYWSDGQLRGVVGADIKLGTIARFLAENQASPHSASALYDGTNLVTLGKVVEPDRWSAQVAALLPVQNDGVAMIGNGLFRDRVVYVALPLLDWHLVVVMPWADFFPYAQSLWMYVVVIGASVAGLAGGLMTLYYRQVAAPLLALEHTLKSLNVLGDRIDLVPAVESTSRFAALVDSLNSLLSRLQTYYQELHAAKGAADGANALLKQAVQEERIARTEIELRESYWRALFDNAKEAIALVDKRCVLVGVNDSFLTLFGWESREVIGKNLDSLVAGHRLAEAQWLSGRIAHGVEDYLTTRLSKSGEEIEVEVSVVPILVAGENAGAYAIYRDVRERRRIERELIHLSQYDQLTGLFNRGTFDRMMREMDRAGEVPICILLGDTNGLKLLNDAFGHQVGDRMLIATAEAIRACIRPGDMAARVGGDEFAVILPNTTERQAMDIVASIEAQCRMMSEGLVQLSITFGASCKSEPEQSLAQFFAQAEDRMYRRKLREGKSVRGALITSLVHALHEKTRDTTAHSNRMGEMARDLAARVGVSGSSLDDIFLLATLHDIGKIGVPDHILNKNAALSPEEWDVMKKHSEIGYRIASATIELAHVAEGILHHHERFDGTGYPYGLQGNNIPLFARIIAVVDAYDAMTNVRAYRAAFTPEGALAEIRAGCGTHFDPELAAAFLEMFG